MNKDILFLFDLDGTLTNTLPLAVEGSKESVKTCIGRALTDEEVYALFGKTENALFKHYCGENWQEGVKAYADYFEEHAAPSIIFEGIVDILKYIKANGNKAAVVTGRGPVTTEIILRKTGLIEYFDEVKTGSEQGSIKAQCMRELLQKWSQPAQKTYYIGDVAQDIKDSREAGVHALSAGWFAQANRAELAANKPEQLFSAPAQFFDFIKNLK